MKWMIVSFLTLLWLGANCADELKFVVLFLRHGARTPRTHISDFKKLIDWPQGTDQLTPSGQRQHYLLGRMMRKKYVEELKFIPPTYNQSKVYIRSTDMDRTIMTAQSFALGLYPTGFDKLTPEQVKNEWAWLPPFNLTINKKIIEELKDSATPLDFPVIPILSFNKSYDKLISFSSCARFYNNRGLYYSTPEFMKVYQEYNSSFQRACTIIGVECLHLQGKDVWNYVDQIVTSEYDERLPELTKFPDLAMKMDEFYTDLEIGELTVEKIMSNIALNDFSKVVPGHFTDFIEKKTPLQMAIYSTHESTMLSYLISLGIPKTLYGRVPYASHIMIELMKKEGRKDDDMEAYYVNMTYNNIPIMELKSLSQFKSFLEEKGKLVDSWEDTCKISSTQAVKTEVTKSPSIVILSSLGTVALILAVIIVILTDRKQKQKKAKKEYRDDPIKDEANLLALIQA